MKLILAALLAIAAPVSLKSVEVSLPDAEASFTGSDADLLNANCTGCHSREMVLTQPRMDAAHWAESVKKMRDVYKAPIEEADAAKLPAALERAQAR
jgi:cytochrome c5